MASAGNVEAMTMVEAAEAFASALAASEPWQRWESAKRRSDADQELSRATKRLAELARGFRAAGGSGRGMPGPELEEMIRLRVFVQDSPLARETEDAAQALVAFLQDANKLVSDFLGLDFAVNAAPRGGGCCG